MKLLSNYRKQIIFSLQLLFILLFLVLIIFPFVFLILTSLRPQGEFLVDTNIIPKSFTLEHYREAFGTLNAFRYFKNSIVITVLVTVISIVFGTIAAYALVRAKFSYRLVTFILFLFIFIRFYPRISIVVPWFLIMNKLQLLDTIWAVVILHVGLTVPFTVWLMYTFFKGFPIELEESASIDGAGFVRRFVSIVLPISKAGIASASIFAAFLSWNEFLLASSVTRESAKTLPVSVAGFVTDKGVLWGPMMSMSALIIIPMVLFALFLQKYLIRGMTMGALK